MFLFLIYFAYAIIPEHLRPLANKALENAKYRKLMTEKKINLLQPGSYEKIGVKFRISKSLFGPPAKEIKGHSYENNYLAIVPNKKYVLSENLTNTAFALNQKMYLLQNIAASDESVSIYQVKEINPYHVITEVIMYTADDKNINSASGSTIKKTSNFNWDDKEHTPVFRPIIPSFPNLKFGIGTKVTASASARLHSRGTNYLQLDLTFKIEGSFGAGIQTISGQNSIEDAVLYEKEFQIWGQSLKLFGFEFKYGLFAYIESSIVDIALNTAIDFTFMHGYNFEAYNRIVVCTGFPSPGYTTTGWQSKAEKIDTVNDARQNGPQDLYSTVLTFSPRLDIGLKLGLELPGSTSSWLRAGIRGEINFEFGADPVMCEFPYLLGKVEPVVSLFIGYDGLKIFGLDVTPSFETTWELYKKTIFSKECAFLDVKVSPEFINNKKYTAGDSNLIEVKNFESTNGYINNVPLYSADCPLEYLISVWKQNHSGYFKPFLFTKDTNFIFDSLYLSKDKYYINGMYTVNNLRNDSDTLSIKARTFNATFSYKKIQMFHSENLVFYDKGEFGFHYYGKKRLALIQADLTGGFTVLKNDDVEFWDDATPNEGWEKTGITSSYLYYGTRQNFYKFKTMSDKGKYKIDIYIKHKYSDIETYYTTILISNVAESILSFVSKHMSDNVQYIFYYYLNDILVDTIKYDSDWLDINRLDELMVFSTAAGKSLYFTQLYSYIYPSVYVRIKKKEIIGPKRYALIPVIEIDFYDIFHPERRPFIISTLSKYFLLKLNLKISRVSDSNFKPDELNQTNFAMLLKCPHCFPICKHAETIDEDYYLIKLTINETIELTGNDQSIIIPMVNTESNLDTKFTVTHFITLNNEGSSLCTHNTVFQKEKMGYFHGTWFTYACLTPKSEAETWNASFYNKFIVGKFNYTLMQIAEIKNRDQVLISFYNDDFYNADILISKDYYNYPVNTSNYKMPDVYTLFKADRCNMLGVYKSDQRIILPRHRKTLFAYRTNDPHPDEEIDFICFCKKFSDAFCEITVSELDNGYFIFDSLNPDGITVTRNYSEKAPRGNVKREVVLLDNNTKFCYTKTWEGNLEYYKLKDEPESYQITVEITALKEKPDFRRIQLLMDGDNFTKYPIGFDVFKYMDDPLKFLSEIDLDKESKPGWIYFGEDNELYVIIDIEPNFDDSWCLKAASLSPVPSHILKSSIDFYCGDGMKKKNGKCVVNNKLNWKFWTIIAACAVALILIVVFIVVMVKKHC